MKSAIFISLFLISCGNGGVSRQVEGTQENPPIGELGISAPPAEHSENSNISISAQAAREKTVDGGGITAPPEFIEVDLFFSQEALTAEILDKYGEISESELNGVIGKSGRYDASHLIATFVVPDVFGILKLTLSDGLYIGKIDSPYQKNIELVFQN